MLTLQRVAAWLALAACAGCASERIAGVPLAPGAGSMVGGIRSAEQACRFQLLAVSDQRAAADLGQLGRTAVDGRGLVDWLAQGVREIPGHTDATDATALRVELMRAYVEGISTMKSAHLVVRLSLHSAGGSARTRVLRGADNSLNWANGQAEVQAALSRARQDLQAQIQAELRSHCAG
jgi:hypothetical protein